MPQPGSVSGRVVALSMLLIGVMCWWIAYSEIKTTTTEITCTALPIGVVFVVFVVAGLNALAEKKWPRFALSPGEMATLYILVAVGSSLAGIGMIGFLTPAIANPVWFTNDKWDRFADGVPAWWSPRDAGAVRDFYLGNSTLYTWPHLRAWFFPIATWGGFLFLLLLMTLCFAVILRRQWVEHERLSFPITILPIAMTAQPGGLASLLRNRAFLFGFLLPVALQSINNLHWLFPNLPEIPLKPTANGPLDLGALVKTPPWNALGYFPLAFHPNTIGLAYLLATDVSFSCWFFYLARKLLDVFCVMYGYRDAGASSASSRMPYMQEQGVGAWLCLAALSLWMARRHLASVVRGALHPALADDAREAMSYRRFDGFDWLFVLLCLRDRVCVVGRSAARRVCCAVRPVCRVHARPGADTGGSGNRLALRPVCHRSRNGDAHFRSDVAERQCHQRTCVPYLVQH